MITIAKTKTNYQHRQAGFTIVELLVATAVFAVVLLLSVVGFMQVNRLFYKGVAVSQTRQAASQIMDSITSDIRLSSGVPQVSVYCDTSSCNSTWPLFCIGNHFYVPNVNASAPLDLSHHNFTGSFGLIQSQSTGVSCPDPTATTYASQLKNPVEMLGDNMRLFCFGISDNTQCPNQSPPSNSGSQQIVLVVGYGDNNQLDMTNPSIPKCKSIATGSQFCSVIQLTATASSRPGS